MKVHRRMLATGLLLSCFAVGDHLPAQTQDAARQAWEKAAGGPTTFEVASVRQDKGDFAPPSFALSADDWFRDPQGRFHADFELPVYIEFAYKLWLSPAELDAMLSKLPGWVKTDRFAINAVAPPHATKDGYRLMMQALLAERFGLQLHFEGKDEPVLAMLLINPGHPGPRLLPHAQGPACSEKPKAGVYPSECYSYSAMPGENGMWLNGSRATTLDLLADFVANTAGWSGEIGRRVVDRTGLTGLWDFTLEAPSPAQPATPDQPRTGPTMLEALGDQLGIKLKPARALVSLPVIDSVQRPGDN